MTTGCFIYPVDITCIEVFDWYIPGSTAEVEFYTKLASKNANNKQNVQVKLQFVQKTCKLSCNSNTKIGSKVALCKEKLQVKLQSAKKKIGSKVEIRKQKLQLK